MIAKILNGTLDNDATSAFFQMKDKKDESLDADSDTALLEVAKKIINDHNNEFFVKLIDHQKNMLINLLGFIFQKFLPKDQPNLDKITIRKSDIVITQDELLKLKLVTVLNFRRQFNLVKCEKQEAYLNHLVSFNDQIINNYNKDWSFQNLLNSGIQNEFLLKEYPFSNTQLEMIKDISVQDLNEIMTKGPGDGFSIAVNSLSLTEIKNTMFLTSNNYLTKYGKNGKNSQETDEKIRQEFMENYFNNKDASVKYKNNEAPKVPMESNERELIIENLLQLANDHVEQLGTTKHDLMAKIKGESKKKDQELINLKDALNRREVIISNTRNSLTKEIIHLKELLNNKNRNENRSASVDNNISMMKGDDYNFNMKEYTELGLKGRRGRGKRDSDAFEDLHDCFSVENQNDKLMINHLEKKMKELKQNYKKKYNKARDQLSELEKKYNDIQLIIEREKKTKPENMLNKLMETLNHNKIKLWKVIQDQYGDHWQNDILLKKDDDINMGINFDTINDACCKRVQRIGMKQISPSNTDPVYNYCINAFKNKITKLNEELNYKDAIIKDLSCVDNNLNILDDNEQTVSNSASPKFDNNTNKNTSSNHHTDKLSKLLKVAENKLNVLFNEFVNVSSTKKTLDKEKVILEQKLNLKQDLIDEFQKKLGLYKEAKELNRSLEKLGDLDPENFSQIPLSRIFDSVESDYLVQYVLLHNIPRIKRDFITQTSTEAYDPEIMDTIIRDQQAFFRQSDKPNRTSPDLNRFICMKCKEISNIGTEPSDFNIDDYKSARLSSMLEAPENGKRNFKKAKKYVTTGYDKANSVSRMSEKSKNKKTKSKMSKFDNDSSNPDIQKSEKQKKSDANVTQNDADLYSQKTDNKIEDSAQYLLDKLQTPDIVDQSGTKKIDISPYENFADMHNQIKNQVHKSNPTPVNNVHFNKIQLIKELRNNKDSEDINKKKITTNLIETATFEAGTQTLTPVDARDQLSYTTQDRLNNSVNAITSESTKTNLLPKRQKYNMKLNLHEHPNMALDKRILPKKSSGTNDSSNRITNISFNSKTNTRNPNNISIGKLFFLISR